MADWIQMKLHQHKLAACHLAAKMGIATSVVNLWIDALARPEARHIRQMVSILGKYGPKRGRIQDEALNPHY